MKPKELLGNWKKTTLKVSLVLIAVNQNYIIENSFIFSKGAVSPGLNRNKN